MPGYQTADTIFRTWTVLLTPVVEEEAQQEVRLCLVLATHLACFEVAVGARSWSLS